MKISDVKPLYELIKEASHVHILIISFLALPFVLDAWVSLFQKIEPLKGLELDALYIVLFFFSLLSIFAITTDRKRKSIELIKDQVVGYMLARNFTRVSFERYRKKHDSKLSDEELISVINTYPNILRITSISEKDNEGNHLKDKDGNKITKPGFGLVNV